jgi:hypothetical protein
MNASLATIQAGFRPVQVLKASDRSGPDGRHYFLFLVKRVRFPGGHIVPLFQYRRQLGQGHSREERARRRAKRNADYAARRLYKRERQRDVASSLLAAPTEEKIAKAA